MRVKFTAGRVAAHQCPPDKTQAFIWDTEAKGLGLKASSGGSKKYVLESRLKTGATVRITIGDPKSWSIDAAQAEARRLQTLIDQGIDPRQQKAEQLLKAEEEKARAKRQTVTVLEAWAVYLEDRKSKWSELNYRDHVDLAKLGGEPKKRGKGMTEPGPLAPLMPLKLSDLTNDRISAWLEKESEKRPSRARLAFNLLRIFCNWCESRMEYRGLIDGNALATRIARDVLPKRQRKTDALQREQLQVWFQAVQQIDSRVMSAYLIGLLLTGARREELAGLKWVDVDFKWRSLTIRDKVEGTRVIPLTPFFLSLLTNLQRINETEPNVRQMRRLEQRGDKWAPSAWVFFSSKSADGRIVAPNAALHRACEIAGIPPVTLHGLRRSFASLAEWTETPTGVVAQIMGHKPSATAERHYKIRPLDLLRSWHDKIEDWILKQAGIGYVPAEQGLRVVSAA